MGETARTLDAPPSPGDLRPPSASGTPAPTALLMPATHPGRAGVARAVVTTARRTGSLKLGPWADRLPQRDENSELWGI